MIKDVAGQEVGVGDRIKHAHLASSTICWDDGVVVEETIWGGEPALRVKWTDGTYSWQKDRVTVVRKNFVKVPA